MEQIKDLNQQDILNAPEVLKGEYQETATARHAKETAKAVRLGAGHLGNILLDKDSPPAKDCLAHGCNNKATVFYIENIGWKSEAFCASCSEKKIREEKLQEHAKSSQKLVEESGLRGKLLNHNFNNFQASCCPRVFDVAQVYAKTFLIEGTHKGLLLTGKPGTGKTHLACAMANFIISENLIRVKFVKSVDLLLQIRWAMNKDVTEEQRLIDTFANVPLLIIDDLGSEKITDWAQQVFYKIIDDRDILEKPIIITSNIDLKSLAERIGDRTASRLASMCSIVQMGNEDFRLKGAS